MHFYYDDECEEGSEEFEPYIDNVKCDHMCQEDGEYSTIQFEPTFKQVCKQCPANSISINGGILLDAKMDSEANFQKKFEKYFKAKCQTMHLDDDSS